MSADLRDRDSVLRDLESPDEEVRRLAVERLVVLPSAESLPRWVACLGDPGWRVRKAAVERLVASPETDRVLDHLIDALADGDNPGRRNAAVEALVELGESAVAPLLAILRSDDVDVRKFGVDALAGIGSPESREALVVALADTDPNVRAAAADALGVVGGGDVPERLRAVAVDAREEALVRFSALRALGRLEVPLRARDVAAALDDPTLRPVAFAVLGRVDDDEAVDRLLKGITTGSRAAREAAMEALLRLLSSVDGERAARVESDVRERVGGDPAVLEDLCERLSASDLSTRLVLVQFLGLLERPECVIPILEAGRDEAVREVAHHTLVAMGETAERALEDAWDALDLELRSEACHVLGRLRGDRGSIQLLAALDEADAELRAAAARALACRGCVDALAPLVHRLETAAAGDDLDAEDEVEALIEALTRLAGPGVGDVTDRAVELIGSRLAGAAEPVRQAFATVLGRIGRSQDAEWLAMLLKDASSGVRRAAVEALSRLDAGVDCEPLRLALADESPTVRVSAAAALGASAREGALDDLRSLLHDDDDRVRAAAVRGIGVLAAGFAPDAARRSEAIQVVGALLSDAGAVAMAAVEALRGIGGQEAARTVAGLLTRSEPELVQAAVGCIGEHGDVDAVEELLPLVAHDHWAVRSETIQILGDRRVVRAMPAILRRLETEQDDFVRDVILRALRRLEEAS